MTVLISYIVYPFIKPFLDNKMSIFEEYVFGDNSGIFCFFFLCKNPCYGYLLEVHWKGTSNEYPQQMFL